MIDLFKTRFTDLSDDEIYKSLYTDYIGIKTAEYGNSLFDEFAYILKNKNNPQLWVYYERRVNYKPWGSESYFGSCLEGSEEEVWKRFSAFRGMAETYYKNNSAVAGGN